mgnify:CR=1 FL=1
MTAFSDKARETGNNIRQKNTELRKKLAEKYGGTAGMYYPTKIRATMKLFNIDEKNIDPMLLKKASSEEVSFPLDHPIFEKKPKSEKKTTPSENENRELVIKLLKLAVKFL